MSGWLGEIEKGKSPAISGRTGKENRQADDLGLADHGNDLTPSRASWTRLSALADDQPGLRALAG